MSGFTENVLPFIISALTNIQYVFAILFIVLFSACFLGRYIVLTRKLVLSSFGVVLLTLAGSIILTFTLKEEYIVDMDLFFNSMLVIVIFVFAFIFYLIAFKEKRILRAIESTISLYLLILYIDNFAQSVIIYSSGGTEEVLDDLFIGNFGTSISWLIMTVISLLITVILFAVVYFGFYKPKKYYVIGMPYRIIFAIWALVFSSVVFLPATMPSEEYTLAERYQFMSIIFAIGVVILGFAAPVMLITLFVERSLREKNKSQEAYLSAQLEYIGQYKKQQVETRAFRHDIKNHLAITQMLLEKGDTEEAKEHINDLLGNVSSFSPKYVTGDEMLDIIVFMKADRMDELNIRFTLDGVADGGLNIKPMDMCSIFANALDNAIEAASPLEDAAISMNIKRTDKFFVIKITNSASGKVDAGKLLNTSGYTSKTDKEHHGFGLMNIRHSVENCNGILKAESDDNSFTLSIMLPRSA